MPSIISATQSASTQTFTVTGNFWLMGDYFGPSEFAVLERPNNAANGYEPVTNSKGVVCVSAFPNTVFVEVPAGTYRIRKQATAIAASVNYTQA